MTSLDRSKVVLAVLLLSALTDLCAQARRGPVRPWASFEVDARWFATSRVVLKFAEGSGVRLRQGRFATTGIAAQRRFGNDLTLVNRKLARLVEVRRLLERGEAELDAERNRILADLPARFDPPADLNLYYLLVAKTEAAGVAVCVELNRLAVVETAFPDHRPGIDADPSGDIPPTTPDYRPRQAHWDAPPGGIDIAAAHQIPGGRGESLQVLDIETGLILDHEDVPQAVARNLIGLLPYRTDHGLAVAGELVAERNAYGVTGGIWKAGYKFHSHNARNWASSVSVATGASRPGDIIVLEVHLRHPGSGQYVPMEHRQDVFDVVRTATLRGIHVIAAAGNGGSNLDDPVYNGIFDRTKRDSGAVLVGATEGGTLVRASFSNFGAIVDANGWGRYVVTTGYGDLFHPNGDVRQKYTGRFAGTSSATPIVASAAGAVLGAARQQLGRVLKPVELRDLLRRHGTPVPNGSIGPRPDLGKLMSAIGLPRGLAVSAPAKLGSRAELAMSGQPNDRYALVVSDAPGLAVLPFGRLLLDPAALLQVAVGSFDRQGKATFSGLVPTSAALLHKEFHWQILRVGAGMDLSNSVVTFIHR